MIEESSSRRRVFHSGQGVFGLTMYLLQSSGPIRARRIIADREEIKLPCLRLHSISVREVKIDVKKAKRGHPLAGWPLCLLVRGRRDRLKISFSASCFSWTLH